MNGHTPSRSVEEQIEHDIPYRGALDEFGQLLHRFTAEQDRPTIIAEVGATV